MFRLLSVLLLAVLTVSGCTAAGEGPATPDAAESGWDDDVREGFLQACLTTSSGSEGYCGCTLAGLEDTFSQAKFERLEQHMLTTDTVPEEFQTVVDGCLADHIDELMGDDLEALEGGRWGAAARAEFLQACLQTSGGLEAYCGCTLDGMEEIYSQTEFTAISLAIERGEEVPPDFDAVVQACLAEHVE